MSAATRNPYRVPQGYIPNPFDPLYQSNDVEPSEELSVQLWVEPHKGTKSFIENLFCQSLRISGTITPNPARLSWFKPIQGECANLECAN